MNWEKDMKPLFLSALVGALVLAPAGLAIAKGASAPGSLVAYVGKYPWDKVNGTTFKTDPRVRAAVAKATPSAEIRKVVLGEDMISPIIKVGDRLLASGWDSRSAGAANWAILAALDGSRMAVCYYTEGGGADWYVDGKVVATRHDTGGCPSEAGDLAGLGSFPIGPMPK
jgi:hypothetical protein